MQRFNLIFSGEISKKFDLPQVKQNFQQRFRLTDAQTQKIFSGDNIVIKKDLSEEQVLRYVSIIDEIGGITHFEPSNGQHLPLGIREDRRQYDRRFIPERRRNFRASSTPDRRIQLDRRQIY